MFGMKRTLALMAALAIFLAAASASAKPWRFGVISDTQWTIADDGRNPNTCAADIIKQINAQFIDKHVKLVVHVGDMVNSGSQVNDNTRAMYAQDLYNAGIGFYPLRGNHEAAHGDYLDSGADYVHAYPQIVPGPFAGINNNTPADITTDIIPALDLSLNPPAQKTKLETFTAGTDFSVPETVNASTGGVSYAFRYKNATFMLLDQFASPDITTPAIFPSSSHGSTRAFPIARPTPMPLSSPIRTSWVETTRTIYSEVRPTAMIPAMDTALIPIQCFPATRATWLPWRTNSNPRIPSYPRCRQMASST